MNFFCSKDCPDLCGINATFENGKYTFKGVSEPWAEKGFVCSKFNVFAEREIDNGILSYQTAGGSKTEYQTDADAVKAMADFLEPYRGKKILFMRGSGSLAYNMAAWDCLFAGFDNCFGTTGGPCDNTGGDAHEADFGTEKNPDVTNLEQADTVILYGKNAAVCSQHLFAYLKKLKKDGKKIIYIDPVKTKTAGIADRYIMINPCCDGLLACALLTEMGLDSTGYSTDELLKISGISRSDFDYILGCVKNGKTAHIQGFGIQRHANGMNAFQWINRLAVKTGSEDMLYYGHGSKRKWEKVSRPAFSGTVHVDRVAQALADGEFDLFINTGANPVMTFPDTHLWKTGLSKTKTVVIDTCHTETSEYADFFLKVGGMFSQADFMGSYFFPHDYERKKLTDEMSDSEAAMMLGSRLGIKINLKPKSELQELPQPDRAYRTDKLSLTIPEASDKFRFITSSHSAYLNSQILPGMQEGKQVIHINPADAEKLGVKNGDDLKVTGEKGHFTAEALITDGIAEKAIMCWKNIPMKEGFLNNAIPHKLTDSGNGLVYYSFFVDVQPV